jgi:hypothetical protein
MPLIQGQSVNVTCLSSPSKPASTLALYKNEQRIAAESSLNMNYELDTTTKRNRTKLIYTIRNPDSSWNNVSLRCEQTYALDKNYQRDVRKKVQVHCKSVELHFAQPSSDVRIVDSLDRAGLILRSLCHTTRVVNPMASSFKFRRQCCSDRD